MCTEKRELSLEQGKSQGARVNCVLFIFLYSSTLDKPEILGITASSWGGRMLALQIF